MTGRVMVYFLAHLCQRRCLPGVCSSLVKCFPRPNNKPKRARWMVGPDLDRDTFVKPSLELVVVYVYP